MPHQSSPNNGDYFYKNQGNAIVIILVMIALIAALTSVAMRTSSRNSNMDGETARIQAENIMRQAKNLESGIIKLTTVNRCSENEISFENTITTRSYTNASAPTNKRCHVYDLAGSGQSYTAVNEAVLDGSKNTRSDYGEWVFTGTHCVLEIGSNDDSTCTDSELALVSIIPHINLQTCLAINNLNGITNPSGLPPIEVYDETATEFIGSFATSTDPEIGELTGTELIGHTTGCFENSSGSWNDSYIFYHVLLAR
jgi:hypothetical protein